MALNIDPPGGTFPASGGNATFSVLNLTEARMAFKVFTFYFVYRPLY
uniref:Uncharacterized protein n=1 Tax=Parascaris equorum TaxID=6256 RepID=A0A914R9W4_PAREQ